MEGVSSPRGAWRPRPHRGGGGPPHTRRGGGGPPRTVGELLDLECTFISTCDISDSPLADQDEPKSCLLDWKVK